MKATKTLLILILTFVFVVSLLTLGFAQEKKKGKAPESKASGQVIYNADKGYVKVLDDNYKTTTIHLDDKTRYEMTAGVSKDNFVTETKDDLPPGTVSYVMKDGKPVATRVSYKSGLSWSPKKKKK